MQDLIDAIADLTQPDTAAGLVGAGVKFARERGFGGAFLVSPISRESRDGRRLTNFGFDETWARAYRRWLHRTDPLPKIVLDRPRPFRWSRAEELKDLSEEERRYLKIMDQRGMGDGLIIPLFGPTARCGMLGLGLHPDLDAVTERDVVELRTFLQMGYLRYCEMLTLENERETVLSKREMDVLLWMSRGKSNAAIGTILDISTDTVDTYVRRIYKKFDVTDRIAAVMAAVRHGYVTAAHFRKETKPITVEQIS